MSFETVSGQGRIARIWHEYLQDAFARVNDVNARKIVLYLARHEPEPRTRAQIRDDLDLTLTDGELEKRMHQLVKADILAYGSSYFHYRGLGDRVFAVFFRRLYGTEIEHLDDAAIVDDFKRELAAAKGRIAVQKGPPTKRPSRSEPAQGSPRLDALGAPASRRRLMRGLRPRAGWEAGAPSTIEAVGTRYASPTSRLEAGAPSVVMVARTGLRSSMFPAPPAASACLLYSGP